MAFQTLFFAGIPLRRIASGLAQHRGHLRIRDLRVLRRWALLLGLSVGTKPLRVLCQLRPPQRERDRQGDPLFILGHWRSGTTHLHYLLGCDPRLGFINNRQAMVPYLPSKWPFALAMPTFRPMDEVEWSLDAPQEEEVALTKLAPGGFFDRLVAPAPDACAQFRRDVLLDDLSDSQLQTWLCNYRRFVSEAYTGSDCERLVLKNPSNTGRLRHLNRLYPACRAVFIHRDPYAVFSSMKTFYSVMYDLLCLTSSPSAEAIEQEVLQRYRILLQRYLSDRHLLAPDRLVEIAYEDLVADPDCSIRQIYAQLDLGSAEEALRHMGSYLGRTAGYRPRHHQLSPREMDLVDQEWSFASKAWPRPVQAA